MIKRLLCLLFGHRPASLSLQYQRPDGSTFSEPGEMLALSPAPGANPLVMNVCARCSELVRHLGREPHYAAIFAERARKEAEDRAKLEAPKPPEPFTPHRKKLRALPGSKPKPTDGKTENRSHGSS